MLFAVEFVLMIELKVVDDHSLYQDQDLIFFLFSLFTV